MRRVLAVLLAGALLALPACGDDEPPYAMSDCVPDEHEGFSVARVWDEALLGSIRSDNPAPTTHSRNLFHTSAAMWDAWAAYDPTAEGYFVDEKLGADTVLADREAAISYAAYRVLLHRYSRATGLQETFNALTATMESLCYRIDYVETEGDSPAALGNRIAATVISGTREDGSLEPIRYVDTTYKAVNPPMVVAEPGTTMLDPNRWQPLALAQLVAQNGLPIPGSVQRVLGPHWGHVKGFALPPSEAGTPIDPGPPPLLGDPESDQAYKDAAVHVIRLSSYLSPEDGERIDIAPGSFGNNPLGTNDGSGYNVNPVTGEPYEPEAVLRGDFARVLAEFWADGPESETPPGHWNTIANEVSDTPGMEFRIGGEGPEVDRLEWDVKLYFTLNGAVHDAAAASWGLKGHYDSVRPISMIRYLGGKGQSSDPGGPSYDPDGLPLEPGLIEVVTRASSATGERHEHLADHVGAITIKAWAGNPEDPLAEIGGVHWIRAVEWVPYQRATFVTPAFAGYVSGHSTFSRAAAEVMASFTGSEYFPGGLMEFRFPEEGLLFEAGPTEDVVLQWATYYDAADQAGISRLFGGIHISADDFEGRKIGSQCGKDAWDLAQHYFDGTA